MDLAHRVGEAQRDGSEEPQRELESDERTGEEPRAGEPGVALEAPPRRRVRQFFLAATLGWGEAAADGFETATASTTPSTLPACSADTTNRW